jgi:hypothetical protein
MTKELMTEYETKVLQGVVGSTALKIVKWLIVLTVPWLISYSAVSFVIWNFDVSSWQIDQRFTMIFAGMLITIPVAGILFYPENA